MTRTADARSRTPQHTERLQGYVYRRPLNGPELLPALGVGIAAGLVAMGLNTSRANTFAAVPGLPDYRLGQP